MNDLRLPLLGAGAWAGALAGPFGVTGGMLGAVLLVVLGSVLAVAGGWAIHRRRATALALVVMVAGAAAVAGLHAARVSDNPVADLAERRAQVRVTATVTTDPKEVTGQHATYQLRRISVREIKGRGVVYRLRTPVVVLGQDGWADVPLGTTVSTTGRLGPSDSHEESALLIAGAPRVVAGPGVWWRASDSLRGSIRDAVAHRPPDQAALVPALVDGDDTGLSDELADDFRTTGLTHLLAVSGTNLTLVVGFMLIVARWAGVRGRGLYAVGVLGILGFIVLARTEPSVVRAAAMGAVGLLAMTHNGRQRALRGLGAAVTGLLLIDPGLATSVGFTLSVLATAGILIFGPPWRDAMRRWMPQWCAEAIAVPAAAQLACTPVVAAISGQVSLVAVLANLLVEPAVAPATVLGLLGGLLGLAWEPLGMVAGTTATWCVAWIIAVARFGAGLPTAQVGWGTGPLALGVLVAVCAGIAFVAPRILRHPVTGVAGCLVLLAVALVRLPTPAWPPPGWVLAMCDVGQGDALAVRTGAGSAVVVDAGPDPDLVDDCLDRLEIDHVPLAVVTHFHADHVSGIEGVFAGRQVGEVWTSRLQDPGEGVRLVTETARSAGVVPGPAPYGATATIGEVRLQVLWPMTDSETRGPGDGSTANDASVVLLVESHGLRLLLTGDIEPEGQERLADDLAGLDVDVLKVPHHGSRYQDLDWLRTLRPQVALTSVGADNDYGHPATATVRGLETGGTEVYRTDRDGSLAVVESGGEADVVTQ
ncbi:competence protein ComEC [Nocardioides luteus]|uniref:Membrane protein n=1 Tax=Nocardioides luteus TaxID=1844 RepID=A0ABQ5T1U0_9ACTN|nr:ComEC/Rec2 family competence protein [Nocardioides luteus]MDR7311575.1 competence protein ComEC [Nocardioides luteus]GGR54667.1 membrane protein [Nocardioides luteus]GLJ70224.1 membrane protein [Nocardioides luteus]